MGYTPEFLTGLYRDLLTVRLFEERQIEVYALGKVPGHIHSGVGEEAPYAGVFATRKEGDYFKITHRPIGAAAILGMPLKTMFAEVMGKETGNARGRGGVLHLVDKSKGMIGFSGTLGCDAGVADGAALSIQMAGTDNVVYTFFGDGTANRGPVYEAMNLAAVWKLPVLFVCNDNQFAISTYSSFSSPVPHPGADRAAGYGMPSKAVDGTDVLAVYEAAKELVAGIRAGNGPAVLECQTYRWRGHFEGDQMKYRDAKVTEKWIKDRDCVANLEKRLKKDKVLTAKQIEQIRAEVQTEIDEAVAFAEASPEPKPEEILQGLYVD